MEAKSSEGKGEFQRSVQSPSKIRATIRTYDSGKCTKFWAQLEHFFPGILADRKSGPFLREEGTQEQGNVGRNEVDLDTSGFGTRPHNLVGTSVFCFRPLALCRGLKARQPTTGAIAWQASERTSGVIGSLALAQCHRQ